MCNPLSETYDQRLHVEKPTRGRQELELLDPRSSVNNMNNLFFFSFLAKIQEVLTDTIIRLLRNNFISNRFVLVSITFIIFLFPSSISINFLISESHNKSSLTSVLQCPLKLSKIQLALRYDKSSLNRHLRYL